MNWLDYLGVTNSNPTQMPGMTPDQAAQWQSVQQTATGHAILPALFALGMGALTHWRRPGEPRTGSLLAGIQAAGNAFTNARANDINNALAMSKLAASEKRQDFLDNLALARQKDYDANTQVNLQRGQQYAPVGFDWGAQYEGKGFTLPPANMRPQMNWDQVNKWIGQYVPSQQQKQFMEGVENQRLALARRNTNINAAVGNARIAEANANMNAVSSHIEQTQEPGQPPGFTVVQTDKRGNITGIKELPITARPKGTANNIEAALKYQSSIKSIADKDAKKAAGPAPAAWDTDNYAKWKQTYQAAYDQTVNKLRTRYNLDDAFMPTAATPPVVTSGKPSSAPTAAASKTPASKTSALPAGALAPTKQPDGTYHKDGKVFIVKDGYVYPGM